MREKRKTVSNRRGVEGRRNGEGEGKAKEIEGEVMRIEEKG